LFKVETLLSQSPSEPNLMKYEVETLITTNFKFIEIQEILYPLFFFYVQKTSKNVF